MQWYSDWVRNAYYLKYSLEYFSLFHFSVVAAGVFFGLKASGNNLVIIPFQILIPDAFVSLSNRELSTQSYKSTAEILL